MRALRDILGAFRMLRETGREGVLASAVHTEGSTYRRAGARMLVLPDDRVIGLISGGCLEGDLLEQARSVRDSGKPRIVRYDMRPEEDIVWGLGLGCAGVVEVLLEGVVAVVVVMVGRPWGRLTSPTLLSWPSLSSDVLPCC